MKIKALWYAALLGLALAVATPAAADEMNQKTVFTFSDSVELPGKTLPAGTYTFRLVDSPSARNVVQVFNKDETELITTLLAVSTERMEPEDEPIVAFAERAENAPPAIQFWFYPGRTIGHEFVYPREQATRIARATNRSVLTAETVGMDSDAMKSAKVTTIDPQGRESGYAERSTDEGGASAESTRAAADMPDAQPEGATASTDTGMTSGVQSAHADAQDRPAGDARAPTERAPVDEDGSRGTMTNERTAATTDRSQLDQLPQTASADPMLLLLALSSFLGLSTLGAFRRF
jgi:hypothetical protein